VSYHIHHKNKKAKVFHGNCRMPFDVEFALMYGINAKTKISYKDISYRKNLVEWMCILNSLYPPDNLTITHPSHPNSNSNLAVGNPKRKPFPQFKTGNNNFTHIKKAYNVTTAKLCAKNNNVVSSFLISTKIINFNNLKIPQNAIPFPKQTFACNRQIFTVWLRFYFLFIVGSTKKLFDSLSNVSFPVSRVSCPVSSIPSHISPLTSHTLSSIALQLIEYM
jgi:hypothetical protein